MLVVTFECVHCAECSRRAANWQLGNLPADTSSLWREGGGGFLQTHFLTFWRSVFQFITSWSLANIWLSIYYLHPLLFALFIAKDFYSWVEERVDHFSWDALMLLLLLLFFYVDCYCCMLIVVTIAEDFYSRVAERVDRYSGAALRIWKCSHGGRLRPNLFAIWKCNINKQSFLAK